MQNRHNIFLERLIFSWNYDSIWPTYCCKETQEVIQLVVKYKNDLIFPLKIEEDFQFKQGIFQEIFWNDWLRIGVKIVFQLQALER